MRAVHPSDYHSSTSETLLPRDNDKTTIPAAGDGPPAARAALARPRARKEKRQARDALCRQVRRRQILWQEASSVRRLRGKREGPPPAGGRPRRSAARGDAPRPARFNRDDRGGEIALYPLRRRRRDRPSRGRGKTALDTASDRPPYRAMTVVATSVLYPARRWRRRRFHDGAGRFPPRGEGGGSSFSAARRGRRPAAIAPNENSAAMKFRAGADRGPRKNFGTARPRPDRGESKPWARCRFS